MFTRSAESPACSTPEADLPRVWQVERWLGAVRTLNVPLCLLLLPLVPGISRPGTVLLAAILAVSDAVLLWLLYAAPVSGCLRPVRALATALDWLGALGVIALCAPFPGVPAPALLLIVLALSTERYGQRGLLAATVGAWLAVVVLTMTQARLLGVRDMAAAGRDGLSWGLVVGVMALGLTARSPARHTTPVPPASPVRPAESPLSPRERQLLELLAWETDGELA